MNRNQDIAPGSQADIKASVDISKVHGGYFGNPENADKFVEVAVASIEKSLPQELSYFDFGGGEGLLTNTVKTFLEKRGHTVKAGVLDANPVYSKKVAEKGLEFINSDIFNSGLSNLDLITMRAVLHYNVEDKQLPLIKKIYSQITPGGFLIHQISAGSKLNAILRSTIVNFLSLGRVKGKESYHWVSVDEALELHKRAGFRSVKLAGYAPSAAWGPHEQWDRFHQKELEEAEKNNDKEKIQDILKRKEIYFNESNALIKEYLKKYGSKETGIEEIEKGKYLIHYVYPIIVAEK